MTKVINPQWYNTLEFLAGALNDKDRLVLLKEINKNYQLRKKENEKIYRRRLERQSMKSMFARMWAEMSHTDPNINTRDLDLTCAVAQKNNIPVQELPFLKREISSLALNHFYFFAELDCDTQEFVLRNSSVIGKKKLLSKILRSGSSNWLQTFGDFHNYFDYDFKFNSEESGIILDLLAKEKHCDYLEESFEVKGLAEYLENDDSTKRLWRDYLDTNKNNKLYAAKILIYLGESSSAEAALRRIREDINSSYQRLEIDDEFLLEEAIDEILEELND